jgi:tungstate transport system substrate-binding protein
MLKPSLLYAIFLSALVAGCGGSASPERVLRLATTTSTRDSGLLDVLIPPFEEEHQVRVDVIAVGTGNALKLGEAGDCDMVLVHARAAEDAFMAAGHGIRREDVMVNTFEILGPADDPAKVRDLDPVAALQKISTGSFRFVSRSDDSGTHKRELKLWESAGRLKVWPEYVETGQGMGATLTIADEMRAYVLTDRGTYLSFRDKIDLVPLVRGAPELENPYGAIVVTPREHRPVQGELANRFVDFLIAAKTQALIRDYQLHGESLFYPRRSSEEK